MTERTTALEHLESRHVDISFSIHTATLEKEIEEWHHLVWLHAFESIIHPRLVSTWGTKNIKQVIAIWNADVYPFKLLLVMRNYFC